MGQGLARSPSGTLLQAQQLTEDGPREAAQHQAEIRAGVEVEPQGALPYWDLLPVGDGKILENHRHPRRFR